MKSITIKLHPLAIAALLAFGLPAVAIAAGTVLTPPVTVTGRGSDPLLTSTNNGKGPGLQGLSKLGKGIIGQTNATSGQSLETGESGVYGQDLTLSSFNAGVRGFSNKGTGVYGRSASGVAITGQVHNGPVAIHAIGSRALTGDTLGDTVGLLADANTGYSGIGVLTTGLVGLQAFGTCDDEGICGGGGTGIDVVGDDGISASAGNTSGHEGVGITAESADCGCFEDGIAMLADSPNAVGAVVRSEATPSPGQTMPPALIVQEDGGPALIVTTKNVGDIASIDAAGNMILKGGLTQHGTPLMTTVGTDGRTVSTYSAQESVPTIEDLGEAQLTNGQAFVSFDPSYRNVIDTSSRYLVFITPDGDAKSLFVTQKSVKGFAVREAEGGHSNISFDYRVVAKPLRSMAGRLPATIDQSPQIAPGIMRNADRAQQKARALAKMARSTVRRPGA